MLEINCDMGEFETLALDIKLFPYVDILNIATGGHAGTSEHVTELGQMAHAAGKIFTAHFGYSDLNNFGRVEHNWAPKEILSQLKKQWRGLPRLDELGGWKWVKFHGALYNRLGGDVELAEVLIPWLVAEGFEGLIAPKYSKQAEVAHKHKLEVKYELFLERRYVLNNHDQVQLMPRAMQGAVIDNKEQAMEQYQSFVKQEEIKVQNLSGGFSFCSLEGGTACVHSDSKIAFELLKAISELKND